MKIILAELQQQPKWHNLTDNSPYSQAEVKAKYWRLSENCYFARMKEFDYRL